MIQEKSGKDISTQDNCEAALFSGLKFFLMENLKGNLSNKLSIALQLFSMLLKIILADEGIMKKKAIGF